MTPAIIWMRHGTCHDALHHPGVHARPDTRLTPRGAAETQRTARNLSDQGWSPDAVLTSDQPRAFETAVIAARILGTPTLHLDDELREWRAPLCVLGKGPDDYPDEYRAWKLVRSVQPDTSLPGGESLAALDRRARQAHQRLSALAQAPGRILAVSHRVFIGMVAAQSAGATDPGLAFAFARNFPLSPAGTWWQPA